MALVLILGTVIVPVETAKAASTTATVKGGWLRLRAEASFDAETISSYFTGTVVTVQGSIGKWYRVTAPDGRTGYMYSDYLTINQQGSGSASGGHQNIKAKVVSSNGLGVRLRIGPGTAYDILAVYPVGTAATILRSGDTWHYVRIGNNTGYMMSQFLKVDGAASAPATSYTAYVTSANGLGVRLRKGPGTSYGVLGLYSVGTKVTVLEHGKSWDKVRIGSNTGYMMNRYLTTTVPGTGKTLTAVTLNDYAPVPGTVLKVTVKPSGASVNYQWLDGNGNKLGTASSYTVKSSDVGKKIYVRVTAKNGYTGSLDSNYALVQAASSSTNKIALTGVNLSNTTPDVGQTVTAAAAPAGATANYVWFRDDGVNLGSGQSYTVKASDAGHAIYCAAYATGNYSGNIASYYTGKIPVPVAQDKAFTGMVVLPASAGQGAQLQPGINVNCDEYTITWYVGNRQVGSGSRLTVTADMAGTTVTCVVSAKTGSGYAGSITSTGCVIPAQPASGSNATSTDL